MAENPVEYLEHNYTARTVASNLHDLESADSGRLFAHSRNELEPGGNGPDYTEVDFDLALKKLEDLDVIEQRSEEYVLTNKGRSALRQVEGLVPSVEDAYREIRTYLQKDNPETEIAREFVESHFEEGDLEYEILDKVIQLEERS